MIISGYTDAEDIIRGVNEAGIYQYVTKPWQPDDLLLTLKNAVRLYELAARKRTARHRTENGAAAGGKNRRQAQAGAAPALSER